MCEGSRSSPSARGRRRRPDASGSWSPAMRPSRGPGALADAVAGALDPGGLRPMSIATPAAPATLRPIIRPRRLRRTPALRALVRETRLHPSMLVAPLFVQPGRGVREPIASMPGVARLSADEAAAEAARLAGLGVGGRASCSACRSRRTPTGSERVGRRRDRPGGVPAHPRRCEPAARRSSPTRACASTPTTATAGRSAPTAVSTTTRRSSGSAETAVAQAAGRRGHRRARAR